MHIQPDNPFDAPRHQQPLPERAERAGGFYTVVRVVVAAGVAAYSSLLGVFGVVIVAAYFGGISGVSSRPSVGASLFGLLLTAVGTAGVVSAGFVMVSREWGRKALLIISALTLGVAVVGAVHDFGVTQSVGSALYALSIGAVPPALGVVACGILSVLERRALP